MKIFLGVMLIFAFVGCISSLLDGRSEQAQNFLTLQAIAGATLLILRKIETKE